jgi:hypothetical protein
MAEYNSTLANQIERPQNGISKLRVGEHLLEPVHTSLSVMGLDKHLKVTTQPEF